MKSQKPLRLSHVVLVICGRGYSGRTFEKSIASVQGVVRPWVWCRKERACWASRPAPFLRSRTTAQPTARAATKYSREASLHSKCSDDALPGLDMPPSPGASPSICLSGRAPARARCRPAFPPLSHGSKCSTPFAQASSRRGASKPGPQPSTRDRASDRQITRRPPPRPAGASRVRGSNFDNVTPGAVRAAPTGQSGPEERGGAAPPRRAGAPLSSGGCLRSLRCSPRASPGSQTLRPDSSGTPFFRQGSDPTPYTCTYTLPSRTRTPAWLFLYHLDPLYCSPHGPLRSRWLQG